MRNRVIILDIIKDLFWEIIYMLATVIYLRMLHLLNKELLMFGTDDVIKVLTYKDGIAIKYFGVALVLLGLGVVIIWKRVAKLRGNTSSFGEMFFHVLVIIVIAILLTLIFEFIKEPILRAIFIACGIGISFIYSMTN